jgi:hypothetical protein
VEEIQMIDCDLIDNDKFGEGGVFDNIIHSIPGPRLCPERGDVPYNGNVGSNIYIVTQKTDKYDISLEIKPFIGNYVDIYFIS